MKTSLLISTLIAVLPGIAHAQCEASERPAVTLIAEAARAGLQTDRATIAHFNVENLYDEYDSPESGCDAPANPGCGGKAGPFNYLPSRPGDYRKKISKLAVVVTDSLRSPDILQAVEVEAQDDCTGGGSLTGRCGPGLGDGKPDALQDLANEIFRKTGVRYEAAGDKDSGDGRGIMTGYVYRADRVRLAPADASDVVLGSRANDPGLRAYPINGEVQNPKALQTPASAAVAADGQGKGLFERSAQVAKFQIFPEGVAKGGAHSDVYVITGHFKSRPDDFIPRRVAQANYVAGLARQLLDANPDANVMAMGDFNTPYEEQLAGLSGSLHELNRTITPASSRFTYNYRGRHQTLDYMFASDAMTSQLDEMHAVHINSDADRRDKWNPNTPNASSDHDPIEATFSLRRGTR